LSGWAVSKLDLTNEFPDFWQTMEDAVICGWAPIREGGTCFCPGNSVSLENVNLIREASRIRKLENMNDATIVGFSARLQLDSGINFAWKICPISQLMGVNSP
jgi:hypothetical protein